MKLKVRYLVPPFQRHKRNGEQDDTASPILAAEYLRMSTEHQQYSLKNQASLIREYARTHGFEIIQTYSDPARSGLTLNKRFGLQHLLSDVLSGNCSYKAILVYDISRWGRFQDTDEAACYEFLCRTNNKEVRYCGEGFENDQTVSSSILKTLKRTMAAEFSRELGIGIFEAKKQLTLEGFWVNGRPAFGLRRKMISANTKKNQILESGEQKNRGTSRVILVRGPRKEIELVQRIYRMVLCERIGCSEIAHKLNTLRLTHSGRRWNVGSIHNILTNTAYTGSLIWSKTCQKLKRPTVHLDPAHWIRTRAAFRPIVSQKSFDRVQDALKMRGAERTWSDNDILQKLRCLLAKKGHLSAKLIEGTTGMPSERAIQNHFGSLLQAYKLIQFTPRKKDIKASDTNKRTRRLRIELINKLVNMFPGNLSICRFSGSRRVNIYMDSSMPISVLICPTVRTPLGNIRWQLSPVETERKNITLLCMLNAANDDLRSFHLLHCVDLPAQRRLQANDPRLAPEGRLEKLSQFYEVAKRIARNQFPEFCGAVISEASQTPEASSLLKRRGFPRLSFPTPHVGKPHNNDSY